jgi:hypothetical protein
LPEKFGEAKQGHARERNNKQRNKTLVCTQIFLLTSKKNTCVGFSTIPTEKKDNHTFLLTSVEISTNVGFGTDPTRKRTSKQKTYLSKYLDLYRNWYKSYKKTKNQQTPRLVKTHTNRTHPISTNVGFGTDPTRKRTSTQKTYVSKYLDLYRNWYKSYKRTKNQQTPRLVKTHTNRTHITHDTTNHKPTQKKTTPQHHTLQKEIKSKPSKHNQSPWLLQHKQEVDKTPSQNG